MGSFEAKKTESKISCLGTFKCIFGHLPVYLCTYVHLHVMFMFIQEDHEHEHEHEK